MVFKPVRTPTKGPDNPEALFRDLRSRKVEGLLSHQADVIRDYVSKALDADDVALELPTGSGKTLVGLLIGEWRRVTRRERVVYLCPTKQLVHQVVEQGTKVFGLRLTGFVGKKADYEPGAKGDYQNAETIAVTTYSALFNSNPFFVDPHVIILDDAHTSENYIAAPWTLEITRRDYPGLFDTVSGLIAPLLSESEQARLSGEWRDPFDRAWSDVIPTVRLEEIEKEIIEILDAGTEGTELAYSWQFIRDHLRACHLFIGTAQLMLRPWIPPTETHAPFAKARQRLYMSATLGQTGDLERVTGREKILRLTPPAMYEKHGVGRRLFLFPERSLARDEAKGVVFDAVRKAGRALFVMPNEATAEELREEVTQTLECPVFDARAIEESKETFLSERQAVAVVANRYDGIDLPKDDCRLLILDSLPRARNLMERFVMERMGASSLLTERITNRIIQAVGRCTRADTDYAVVIALGEELGARLLQPDQRQLFHPEMQAELEFGVQQSSDASAQDFLGYIDAFLAQDEEWEAANTQILELRENAQRFPIPGAEDLAAAAPYEVQYQYALWSEDWERGLDAAREVIAVLTHPSLRGYRALWYYLAGTAAWLIAESGLESMRKQAREYFQRAHRAVPTVRWLRDLARIKPTAGGDGGIDDKTEVLVIRAEGVLESLGLQNNRRFTKEVLAIRTGIESNEATTFEAAHVRLGRILGFDAGNMETPGAPDPWWIVDDDLCFVFEDHSDADPNSALSITKARQAASHAAWARANLSLSDDAHIVTVLITPVKRIDPAAKSVLSDVSLWSLEDFREWARKALEIVREIRTSFPGSGDCVWRAQAAERYRSAGLSPADLLQYLKNHPASELPIK